MTTELDDDFAELIPELLAEFGKAVTFKTATQTYDPTLGRVTDSGAGTSEQTVIPPSEVLEKWMGSTTLDEGQMVIGLGNQGLTFTPYKGQRVTIDSEDWKVHEVKPIYTGTLIGLYILVMTR